MKHLFFILMTLAVGLTASAQSKREVMRERVDSVLRKNYEKGSHDTLYMKRPDSKLTLKQRTNLSGYYQHSKFSENGNHYNAKLNTDTRGNRQCSSHLLWDNGRSGTQSCPSVWQEQRPGVQPQRLWQPLRAGGQLPRIQDPLWRHQLQ